MSIPLIAFTGFAIAASWTPGPNNIMLAAGSARYGARAVLPMAVGIQIGFATMLLCTGFGLALSLLQVPLLQAAMRWGGVIWLLWLAWKIGSAPAVAAASDDNARPALGLAGAALFQLINPKAWLLCLAVASSWISPAESATPQVLTTTSVFLLVGIPASIMWIAIGSGTARLLGSPGRIRVFNIVMALLLAASVLPLVL
jgi:threonine/homoserine/homoserine lactone efflux protein